jgi:hypothetical protein
VSLHVLFLSNEKARRSSEDLFRKNKFTANHENAEKCRRSKWQAKCSSVLQADQSSIRYGSIMRPLFAIFSLLLCLIATRADELPVIKDSEAVQYVGKNVEVRGLVVSVTTSPLGTACISFGREYPDRRSPGSLQLGLKWKLTSGSLRSKGKSSASPA